MSATLDAPIPSVADDAATGRRPSLFRAELHRFRSRRFIQILLGLAVLGWLGATALSLLHYGVPTPADHVAAQQTVQQVLHDSEAQRQQCLDDPSVKGSAQPADGVCGPPLTASSINENDFLPHQPFDFAQSGSDGALGFAVASAVLAFLIGATWIGAEWSTRSLVALLFWVPRRLTVMSTKLGVLVMMSALLGLLSQGAWLAMAGLLRAVDSTGGRLPNGFWSHLLATQGRGVLLTVFAALLGFGLTNLIRNTGAALGIGFVYFAVLETAIRILRPAWQPWLLSENAVGLLLPGGESIYIYDKLGPQGFDAPRVYHIDNLQAGLTLTVITAVIIGIGVLLFQRRDLH
jgi:hypothetical protein